MDGVPGRVLPGRRTGPVGAQTALARGELPCFDLSCFATGAEGSPARESLAGALDEALSRTGFFLVTGHGIEPGVRRAMFAAAAAFFSEPLEVKRRLAIGNSPAHRGYVGIGAESLDDTGRGDAKESLDTGGEQGPDHPEVVAGTPLFGPNQWPRTPGFREAWERYFAQAVEAAARVQRALAHALGLTDDDILAPPGGETMYHLRFIHYPSQRAQPLAPGQLGSGVHTDYVPAPGRQSRGHRPPFHPTVRHPAVQHPSSPASEPASARVRAPGTGRRRPAITCSRAWTPRTPTATPC